MGMKFSAEIREPDESPLNEEERDLGFGSVVTSTNARLLNRDGSFNVTRTGFGFLGSLYLYHWLLNISWRVFLGVVLGLYLALNLLFGFAFWLCGPAALADVSLQPISNHFGRAFFFSVHTFATIGYGTLHPIGAAANWLVTAEAFVGILAQALVTGVVFARFSRPRRISFSASKPSSRLIAAGAASCFASSTGATTNSSNWKYRSCSPALSPKTARRNANSISSTWSAPAPLFCRWPGRLCIRLTTTARSTA
jgi:inward rectifier potassium channel